jgi:hypothetical protein
MIVLVLRLRPQRPLRRLPRPLLLLPVLVLRLPLLILRLPLRPLRPLLPLLVLLPRLLLVLRRLPLRLLLILLPRLLLIPRLRLPRLLLILLLQRLWLCAEPETMRVFPPAAACAFLPLTAVQVYVLGWEYAVLPATAVFTTEEHTCALRAGMRLIGVTGIMFAWLDELGNTLQEKHVRASIHGVVAGFANQTSHAFKSTGCFAGSLPKAGKINLSGSFY